MVRGKSRIGEVVLVGATFLILVWHLVGFGRSLGGGDLPVATFGVLVGALLLDGVTGVVHWACDTWGDETTPLVGDGLVRSFREHHRDPRAMLVHGWLAVNRETLLATLVTLLVLAHPGVHGWLISMPFVAGVVYSMFGFGCISNQYHYWAHADRAPRPVRWLQAYGVILSPEHHARHHRAPQISDYCIATGWLNPVLNGVGAWRRVERAITRLTGARPREKVIP